MVGYCKMLVRLFNNNSDTKHAGSNKSKYKTIMYVATGFATDRVAADWTVALLLFFPSKTSCFYVVCVNLSRFMLNGYKFSNK